jgi:hypothetical protein
MLAIGEACDAVYSTKVSAIIDRRRWRGGGGA